MATIDSNLPKNGPRRGEFAILTRLRATTVHFLLSVLIGALVFSLVRLIWYPGPLFSAMSASGLLALIIGIDVVLGPVLTALVFNPAKRRHLLILDLTIIGCVQLAALIYGVWTTAESRPAYIVLYGSELQVVRSTDISPAQPFQHGLTGPVWVYVKGSGSASAELDTFIAGLTGRVAPVYDTTHYLPLEPYTQQLRTVARLENAKLSVEFVGLLTGYLHSGHVKADALMFIPMVVQNRRLLAVLDHDSLALVALLGPPSMELEN